MKYTSGPWTIFRNLEDNLDAQYRICGPISHKPVNQFTLAQCGGFTEEEAEANAHLIASAPGLLEACEETIQWYEEWLKNHITTPPISQIRQAVAKAKWR